MPKIPKPMEGARFCPLLGQGCIGRECALWTGVWGKKPDQDEPVLDEECALVWNVLLQRETLVETARVTAGQDKVANQTEKVGQVIAFGIHQARERSLEALESPNGPTVVE